MPPDDRFRPRPGDQRFQPAAATTVSMAAVSLSGTARSLTVDAPAPGTIIIHMASVAMSGAARPLSVAPGSVSVPLDVVTLGSSIRDLSVVAVTRIAMSAVSAALQSRSLLISTGRVIVLLDALSVCSSARAARVVGGVIALSEWRRIIVAAEDRLVVIPE